MVAFPRDISITQARVSFIYPSEDLYRVRAWPVQLILRLTTSPRANYCFSKFEKACTFELFFLNSCSARRIYGLFVFTRDCRCYLRDCGSRYYTARFILAYALKIWFLLCHACANNLAGKMFEEIKVINYIIYHCELEEFIQFTYWIWRKNFVFFLYIYHYEY